MNEKVGHAPIMFFLNKKIGVGEEGLDSMVFFLLVQQYTHVTCNSELFIFPLGWG
jgi:hypothetical protein